MLRHTPPFIRKARETFKRLAAGLEDADYDQALIDRCQRHEQQLGLLEKQLESGSVAPAAVTDTGLEEQLAYLLEVPCLYAEIRARTPVTSWSAPMFC